MGKPSKGHRKTVGLDLGDRLSQVLVIGERAGGGGGSSGDAGGSAARAFFRVFADAYCVGDGEPFAVGVAGA
jgi:hypothetical protein